MSGVRVIEFPADEYMFERFRYGCEKAGKKADEVMQFFLGEKVVPTSSEPKKAEGCDKQERTGR